MAIRKNDLNNYRFDAVAMREAVGPGFQSGVTERLIRRTSSYK